MLQIPNVESSKKMWSSPDCTSMWKWKFLTWNCTQIFGANFNFWKYKNLDKLIYPFGHTGPQADCTHVESCQLCLFPRQIFWRKYGCHKSSLDGGCVARSVTRLSYFSKALVTNLLKKLSQNISPSFWSYFDNC